MYPTVYIRTGDQENIWQLHAIIKIIKQPLLNKHFFPLFEISSSYSHNYNSFHFLRKLRETLRGLAWYTLCALKVTIFSKFKWNLGRETPNYLMFNAMLPKELKNISVFWRTGVPQHNSEGETIFRRYWIFWTNLDHIGGENKRNVSKRILFIKDH